ncbi:sensor histidine kinase [Staphylococcus hyicus]
MPIVTLYLNHQTKSLIVSIVIWFIFMLTTCLLTFLTLNELKRYLDWIIAIHCCCIVSLAFFINPSIVILFVFLTFYLPIYFFNVLSRLMLVSYFVSLFAIMLLTCVLFKALIVYVIIIECILIASFIINYKNEEKHVLEQRIQHQEQQINTLLAEQERQRIAQDLHDTLGHVFASIAIKSELAQNLIASQPHQAKVQMEDIQTISKDTLNQVRRIVDHVKWITFESEVERMEQLLLQANVQFKVNGTELLKHCSIQKQTTLAMILREAMNNVIKHSKADCVILSIKEHKRMVEIVIQDNGAMLKDANVTLKSIAERVNTLNGNLKVVTSDSGLKLLIWVQKGELA